MPADPAAESRGGGIANLLETADKQTMARLLGQKKVEQDRDVTSRSILHQRYKPSRLKPTLPERPEAITPTINEARRIADRANAKRGEASAGKEEETTPKDDETNNQRVERAKIETQKVDLRAWREEREVQHPLGTSP